MCVLNKQFELLEFFIYSVSVDLQYDESSLPFTAGSVRLCGVCSPMVVLGLFVRLCVASPHLFAMYTEMIMKSLEDKGGL